MNPIAILTAGETELAEHYHNTVVPGRVAFGARRYNRERDLPGLGFSRAELDDTSPEGREHVIARIEALIRGEREWLRSGYRLRSACTLEGLRIAREGELALMIADAAVRRAGAAR